MSEPRHCPQCDAEVPANSPAGLCPRCLLKASADSQSAAREGEAPAEPGPTKLTPPNLGFVPPSVEELAPLFPQLEILELLGKGGMGAVYKARQPGLDRLVALKILPPEISRDPAFAERFQREARALAKLSHPHIVAVYDFGQTSAVGWPPSAVPQNSADPDGRGRPSYEASGLCYIVMEFVDGANLRQTIRNGALKPTEALAIVPQICEALQFAHDEGVVHRDIKPENILIDKRGRVKIADFGLAKLLGADASDHSLTATHQVMGTLRYMAPEQMQGSREVDHRADIYSLGVVFYELLTGELPMGRFAPPSKKVQVDVRLDEVVLRALEQDPEQRYQHASDVKGELDTIRSTPAPSSVALPESLKGVESGDATPFNDSGRAIQPTVSPQIRRQLKGPAIALMLYGLLVLFPAVLCFTNGFDIADGNDTSPAIVGFGLIAMSFLLLGLAGLLVRGGWHMLAVEGYRAAFIASFLGQPVGLWGLFVLSRPEVKTAFVVASPSYTGPRLSRLALIGAIWAPLFFVAAAGSMVSFEVPAGEYAGPTWWQLALAFTLLPLGVLAPFGTTILGAVGIAKINRSEGKLYGLRLAQADALLFPLLVMGALAFLAGFVILRGPMRGLPPMSAGLDEWFYQSPRQEFVAFLIALPIWFFPARALFRRVVGPRDAFEIRKLPLVGDEPITGKAALIVALAAIAAHGWPWHWMIPPNSTARTISNFDVHSALQSVWLLMGSIGLSLFASGATLARPAKLVLRIASIGAAIAAFVIQVQFFQSLGEYEPGQPTVVRQLRTYSHMGVYVTMALTGLASLLLMLRLFENGRESHSESAKRVGLSSPNSEFTAFADLGHAPQSNLDARSTPQESLPYLLGWFVNWLLHERWFVVIAQTVTALIYAVCLIAVFGFQSTSTQTSEGTVTKFLVGQPSAWLTLESSPSNQHVNFEVITLTHFVALFGLASLTVYRWLEQRQSGKPHSMNWHYFLWGVFFAGVSGFGFMVMTDSAQRRLALMASTNQFEALPPLGAITNGIGAEFTVPSGHVATLEIVTRRDGETVAVPPHCGYVMAPPNRGVAGTFRWTRKLEENASDHRSPTWSLEIQHSAGRGYSEGLLLPVELSDAIGTRKLILGTLQPNEEVIHWGTDDANNLPDNGLIGLRVTVVAHGLNTGGAGNAHIDWKKTQSATSTTRRKLSETNPRSAPRRPNQAF